MIFKEMIAAEADASTLDFYNFISFTTFIAKDCCSWIIVPIPRRVDEQQKSP